MAEDQMRYDIMAQDALRSVIRLALKRVEAKGLPGEHHFFIAVATTHPGVKLSKRLREKYPEEITIVLQHQFWNLKVFNSFFEVELSFDNAPEKLVVPYAAVKGFFDPSVQFGLQFEVSDAIQDSEDETDLTPLEAEQAEKKSREAKEEPDDAVTASNDDSTVVSLDSFRKK
ncbi:MAG TPA: hypothetical protein ENJ99_00200 [Rhizobiales bacterium]|nr:hypothetical protein [Hyphomicrobiales bacterium]